jgi:1,2-diacylglycerol 3-beta-galactosyltransferase
LPVVLLVGGGEGMGKLRPIAQAISDAQLPVQLVVIAGRNEKLRRDLEARPWKIPVKVNDFVTNMPEWMRAADVIVTKAGPGTVIEAVATGLPILLSGYVHGQENGNVAFVEQNGLGVLRESPRAIVAQLREWLTPGNSALAEMQARARALAHPHAAQDIAVALDEQIRASSAAVDLPARRLRVVTTAVARAKQVWSVHFSLPPAAFLPRMRRGVEAAKRYLGR